MTFIKNLLSYLKKFLHFQTSLPLSVQQSINKKPVYIPREKHILSRKNLSPAAVRVLYKLHKSGYKALLVGGGVRDSLLKCTPKDFDIVTNASPEQVRALFNRCRLIGRRFVLAHVYVNKEIIEVATFRASHKNNNNGIVQDGRIIRDNVYGKTVDEDALRRDFTVNSIYYDISNLSLLDYANGMEDLKNGVIRLIGDPSLRYQEDPVRMLRAIRFVAKLDFTMAPETAAPIKDLANLLKNIPAARLFEEVQKLFLTGHAVKSLQQMRKYNLFVQLFPLTDSCLHNSTAATLIEEVLANTDARQQNNESITAGFLFAALLWPPLSNLLPKEPVKGVNQQEVLFEAIEYLLKKQQKYVAIPKRIAVLMQDIWLLQLRLTRPRRGKKKSFKLLEHPRFRAGYDFLLLRVKAGDKEVASEAAWWTKFMNSNARTRNELFSQAISPTAKKGSQRRRTQPKDEE